MIYIYSEIESHIHLRPFEDFLPSFADLTVKALFI